MIGIYKITNKVNEKVYIGQSWDVENRWLKHKRNTHNKHLLGAFNKYGIENFIFETVMTFKDGPFTQSYLDKFEDYFIQQNDCMNQKKGYNKKGGGSNGKLSEETKKKVSESHIGIKPSNETCFKISKTLTGKKQSEETKQKRSISNTGQKRTPEQIERMISARSYPPMSEETKEKIRQKNIGRKRSFESVEKSKAAHRGIPLSDEHKQKLRETKSRMFGKKVICLDTDEIFSCPYDASLKYGISQKQMTACCRGEQPTCGGFHWQYA